MFAAGRALATFFPAPPTTRREVADVLYPAGLLVFSRDDPPLPPANPPRDLDRRAARVAHSRLIRRSS
ncbi:MAG: hypothetical protein KGM43_03435 [Planctomycetota bacterium]|nr:hypothetical protein [Planctomycetota bacterium]